MVDDIKPGHDKLQLIDSIIDTIDVISSKLYVNKNIASNIIDVANRFNIDAKIIGSCKSSKSKKLTIISQYGTFEY